MGGTKEEITNVKRISGSEQDSCPDSLGTQEQQTSYTGLESGGT